MSNRRPALYQPFHSKRAEAARIYVQAVQVILQSRLHLSTGPYTALAVPEKIFGWAPSCAANHPRISVEGLARALRAWFICKIVLKNQPENGLAP
ncbi:hypothetical protein J6590_052528 [Homalodisca vitripennis]|nr:hypothetical protein J6590_052528 [Homalodisca vitripennis]